MSISTAETTEEICVRVEGDLDLSTVPTFQSIVARAIETREERTLVVDLVPTDYIDSAGLEQLLIVNRKLVAQGGRLRVNVEPGSQPQTVLTITGFSAVMDVETSVGSS